MKTALGSLLAISALVGAGTSAEGDAASPRFVAADLDRDGKLERITWVKFAETEEEGEFFQMRVLDDDGALMWEGPKVRDIENPLALGSWHFGVSFPELAADIDGDGSVELVVPAPQSDVSPTYFRILRWSGDRFVAVRSGSLLESPPGSGKFPWAESDRWQGTWIQSFEGVNADGTFRVEVVEYLPESTPRTGEANIAGDAAGFGIAKWVVAMKPLPDLPSPEKIDGSPGGGAVVYRARLGHGDHFNSAGVRLGSVGDILRQDRANYHGGKGDDEDGPDPVFGTREGRAGMEARRVVPVGASESGLREAIIKGTPLVEVEVTPGALKVRLMGR